MFTVDNKLAGVSRREVAEVVGIDYPGVRGDGVFGQIEEQVVVVGGRIVVEAVVEVQRESVAEVCPLRRTPVVAPRLFVAVGTADAQGTTYAFQCAEDALAVARLCHHEQFAAGGCVAAEHGLGGGLHQRGGEAVEEGIVAPLKGMGATVSAPEQQHVLSGIARQHRGCAAGLDAQEYVADVLGAKSALS